MGPVPFSNLTAAPFTKPVPLTFTFIIVVPAFVLFGVIPITVTPAVGACTAVAAVEVLLAALGSLVLLDTVAVFVMVVPFAVLALTCTTRVKVDDPKAKLRLVHTMEPVAPGAGRVGQLQPAGIVMDWKFVLAGVASLS